MTIFIGGDNSEFLRKWESVRRALRRGLGSEAMAASESILTGLAAATAALGAFGAASIKMAGDMQANKRAFSTLLGDTKQAEAFLEQLAQFASVTPFELPGLTTAAKKLLAFGFAAQDVIPIMAAIGDAAAMLGIGQEGIDRLTLAIGQMQAKGKVSGEEMRQLAEAGIPAWQFLADAIGVSIPEAMDKAEKGTIDSTTGINAMLMGMQAKFKGGMEGLSHEIPGLLSTIKDNASAVMRQIGDKLIDSLDIKGKLEALATDLGSIAQYIKANGINEALKNLIPKELSLAIFAVAGALAGAAVPAIIAFGIALWTAMVPLLPFIAAGAALGATAWMIWQAWEPLGDLFGNVWTAAVSYTQQKWAELKSLVYGGVASVLSAIMPLLNLFGGGLKDAASEWLTAMQQGTAGANTEAVDAAGRLQAAVEGLGKAYDGIGSALTSGTVNFKDLVSSVNLDTTFKGLTKGAQGIGEATQEAGKEAEKAWEKLEAKARQVSKAIYDQWVQTTKTELEQLDIWLAQQLADLEETKDANENYQRDVLMLEAVYSARRRKILDEEAKKRTSIWDQAADAMRSLQQKLGGIGLSGVVKQKYDIETDAENQITELQRKYRDWTAECTAATDQQKADFRAAWEGNGIQFRITEQGMADFSRQIAAEQVAIEAEKNQKLKDLHYERVKFQEDLEQARADGDVARYQELLTTEQAMAAQDLAGRQKYLDTYYEVWKGAHQSTMEVMAETMSGFYDGLQGFFSDVITGTKSIGDAWRDLGRSILKIIADIAAKWAASQITLLLGNVFGGTSGSAGQTTAGGLTGSQQSLANQLLPTVFAFASGGDYSGGLALVGEEGPELINFNRGGRIYNARDTQNMLASQPTIIMNITTPDIQSFKKSQSQIYASAYRASYSAARRNG